MLSFLSPLGWRKAKSKWPWESGIEGGKAATSLGLLTNEESWPLTWNISLDEDMKEKETAVSGATEFLLGLVTAAQPSLNNSLLNWITNVQITCSRMSCQDDSWMRIRAVEMPQGRTR